MKFDGKASGITPDRKKSKEAVKQGETRELRAPPGESPETKVRFLSDYGDGGDAAVTVRKSWLKTTGQMNTAKVRCLRDSIARVEPDLDVINTEAALDRLLENDVVRDLPRDEGAGVKHLTTKWEKNLKKRNNE